MPATYQIAHGSLILSQGKTPGNCLRSLCNDDFKITLERKEGSIYVRVYCRFWVKKEYVFPNSWSEKYPVGRIWNDIAGTVCFMRGYRIKRVD